MTGPAGPGKGRPTPKRRDARGGRSGPVPPPPTSRREASKRLRAKREEARAAGTDKPRRPTTERQLKRDAGPVRELVRDVVDGRRNVATLVLPVVLAYLLAQLTGNDAVEVLAVRLYTLVLLLVVADVIGATVLIRRQIKARFPDDTATRGHVLYGLLRSTTLRRFRLPRPRVTPGPLLGRFRR